MLRNIISTIFLLITALSISAAQNKNTSPDFAYPQKVITESNKAIDAALHSNNSIELIDALVQYSIAQSQISPDNFGKIVGKIDSINTIEPNVVTRSIITSFKASIYYYYLTQNYYRFQSRTASTTERSDDVNEWSMQQITDYITELITESISSKEELLKVPVTEYKSILTYNKWGAEVCPTIYDFIAFRSLNFPLLESPELKNRLLKLIADAHKGDIPVEIYAYMQNDTDYSFNTTLQLYDKYYDNEYSILLLCKISNISNTYEKATLYHKLMDAVDRFSNSPFAENAYASLDAITWPAVCVDIPSIISSKEDFTCSIVMSNINNAEISLYRINNPSNKSHKETDYTLVSTKKISNNLSIPFYNYKQKVEFGKLAYGVYTIGISYSHNGKKVSSIKDSWRKVIVSDMLLFSEHTEDSGTKIFAVNGSDGSPLKNITLEFQSRKNSKKTKKHLTNKDGFVVTDESDWRVYAIDGEDKYTQALNIYTYGRPMSNDEAILDIFTNLGVYRPGEDVQFAAICYTINRDHRCVIDDKEITVLFRNANREVIDSISLTTDDYGRIAGVFKIPESGEMNGTFNLEFKSDILRYRRFHSVEVAEYKAPTFEIEFFDTRNNYSTGDSIITIKGRVESYSGVPFVNTKIDLSLTYSEWYSWWRINNIGKTINNYTCTTDTNGEFSLCIPMSVVNKDEYRKYYIPQFTVTASATSNSGETQTASTKFTIGDHSLITLKCDSNIDATLPFTPLISVESTSRSASEILVSFIREDSTVMQQHLKLSPEIAIDITTLPSGTYDFRVSLCNDTSQYQDTQIVVYRPYDTICPTENALWIPKQIINQEADGNINILLGSNTESHLRYTVVSDDKLILSKWAHYAPGMHTLTITLPTGISGNYEISLYSVKNFTLYEKQVTILPYDKPRLNVEIESFRDKVSSGDTEIWRFKYQSVNGAPVSAALLLNIYNKALDKIHNNQFEFRPATRQYNFNVVATSLRNYSFYFDQSNFKKRNIVSIKLPELNMYNQILFRQPRQHDRLYTRGLVPPSAADGALQEVVTLEESSEAGAVAYSAKMASNNSNENFGTTYDEIVENNVDESILDNVTLRDKQTNVAMWSPLLVSNKDGDMTIEFKVPDNNTTWAMKAIAYTKDLLFENISRQIVSSKPIMVQPNLPRFLRQEDMATITASILNSSDTIQQVYAQVELFNPVNNGIISRRNFNLTIERNQQSAIAIEWNVPDSISAVGYRIKAANEYFSDGEQDIIPVLTSISPIIESHPFYIDDSKEISIKMPKVTDNAKMRFEYCDNPAWLCITALPSLFNQSSITATSLAHTLYSIYVAKGITKNNRKIDEAIRYWESHPEDSVLVSMLEQNKNLKIKDLETSPWLSDAQKQTLRMKSISLLLDDNYTSVIENSTIEKLKGLQKSDGGFAWFKECSKSSYYVTSMILELLGEVKNMGFLPDNREIERIINNAIKYLDTQSIIIYNSQHNKNDFGIFTSYAYIRSFYNDIPRSKYLQELTDKAIDIEVRDWKNSSIMQKAYTTILLCQSNRKAEAAAIVKSIKEFAISTPSEGTYWEYINTDKQVAATINILRALSLFNPDDIMINKIKLWILINKQSNDWGNSSMAVNAIYAILSTGNDWLHESNNTEITIGKNVIEVSELERYTGNISQEIDLHDSNDTISIVRNQNTPAWGAIVMQYSAPMASIKSHSTDNLSIEKDLFVISADSLIKTERFKVGDKVRVMLTIKNNKALEYVTITDERSATIEPMSQLSTYTNSDGLWYYQEIKNESTNIFIAQLPKGTYRIYYDVTITSSGEYNSGIATIQCQYAPEITAHSAGDFINVE